MKSDLPKVHIISDLHLRFKPYTINPGDADFIVIAGDIDARRYTSLRDQLNIIKKPTFAVPGNHEFYKRTIDSFHADKPNLGDYGTWLNRECAEIQIRGHNIKLIGATLWTNIENELGKTSPELDAFCEKESNDFRYIIRNKRMDRTPITTHDVRYLHARDVSFIDRELNKPFDGTKFVITHFIPHRKSIDSKYITNRFNAMYVTHLPELVNKADVWAHGHTHHASCYETESKTLVICNPRGYPGEDTGFKDGFSIDIHPKDK